MTPGSPPLPQKPPETPLSHALRTLLPNERGEEITKAADAFDAASVAEPLNAKKLLGTWARARRIYCEITGEPLV